MDFERIIHITLLTFYLEFDAVCLNAKMFSPEYLFWWWI